LQLKHQHVGFKSANINWVKEIYIEQVELVVILLFGEINDDFALNKRKIKGLWKTNLIV
jgi:hypothetical protein